MKQKDIFLNVEGNAWFDRNEAALTKRSLPGDDPILMQLIALKPLTEGAQLKILEIGCGNGVRLSWLKNNMNADCHGIEPSLKAVAVARANGVQARQGTADSLPFESQSFDVVIFGFCLYLCDREDLFQISREADRVLKRKGWIAIQDFFSPVPRANVYHHLAGVQTYKMDYRKLFDWHPDYECIAHRISHHCETSHTDDPNEWVAVSVMRKFGSRTAL